ncbi:MAG TPA: 2-C-methyl-D-erythritol 4-phosphate cytidylyltransferase, partial [Chloroflexota bacterium]|nr:2-C-methyl-D-erythritol 4-phosphate cytidylyltransferase [Chloroflexota bacterium]
DKVWLPLGGVPVVAYSVKAFAACNPQPRVALVVSRERLSGARALVGELGIDAVVCVGGERRQDSVQNGLAALGNVSVVAIHDGARPLVSPELIERCYAEAANHGAAVPGVPVRDTLKRVSDDGWVQATVDRGGLWGVQTPQVFRMELLLEAYAALRGEVTDDAAVVEGLGRPIKMVPGDPRNLKLTTREDLIVARALLGLPATEGNG